MTPELEHRIEELKRELRPYGMTIAIQTLNYKRKPKQCRACGKRFTPVNNHQVYCGDSACISIRNHEYYERRKRWKAMGL